MTTKKRPATQGVVRDIAISPDGTRLIYTAGGQSPLMVRTIDRLDTFPLAGTAQARAPFSSPDGRWVGFFTGGDAGGELKKCRSPADRLSRCAESTAMDLLLKGDASLVSFNMTESDIELIMRQPFTMTCTDGDLIPFGQGKPHPRGNGAFARKIRVYVNERGTDLPFAIRSMTSLPASVFGLKDRVVLRPGAWAGILICDPAKVRDAATFLQPHQMPEGMEYVLVNGVIEKDANAFTGRRTAVRVHSRVGLPGVFSVPHAARELDGAVETGVKR